MNSSAYQGFSERLIDAMIELATQLVLAVGHDFQLKSNRFAERPAPRASRPHVNIWKDLLFHDGTGLSSSQTGYASTQNGLRVEMAHAMQVLPPIPVLIYQKKPWHWLKPGLPSRAITVNPSAVG